MDSEWMRKTMTDNGKGDSPRPLTVTKDEFDRNWELVFGERKFDSDCYYKEGADEREAKGTR